MAERTVAVALVARMQGFKAGMASARGSVQEFGGELDRLRRDAPGKLHDVSIAAGAAGIAMAGLVGWALSVGMAFDKQMSEVQAVTGATADELGRLRDAALQAGKETVFSATEAAKAQAELAKAGLTTEQILSGGLSGALSLAAAGSLDLAEAADIAAKTMTVFNLKADQVGHIADMLAGAANATSTDVHEMGEALRMGGLAADAAGMSMDDTVVTLGAFADSALVGSDAGTSLKTMLQMLAAPTEKSSKLMKELGINTYDAQGNFIGAAGLAEELKTKLGGLTQQQRNAALATIFGSDAMRAANVLYGLGADGLQRYTERINAQADAAGTAAIKTDNLAGDVERLKGSLETLAIEAGEGANGGVRMLVQALDSLVGWFSDLPGPVQTGITVLAGAGGAALLAAVGFLKVKQTVGDALDALRDMGKLGGGIATGIGAIGRSLGVAGLAVGGVLLLAEGLDRILGDRAVKPVTMARDVDALTRSLQEFSKTGKVVGEMATTFGPRLQSLSVDLQAIAMDQAGLQASMGEYGKNIVFAAEVTEAFNQRQAQAKVNLDALDQSLAKMVGGGNATAAKVAYEELAARVGEAGGNVGQLAAQLPQYRKATDEAALASSGLARGFGTVAQNSRTMAGTLQDAIGKGQTLTQVFDQIHGAALNFSDATIAAEQAADDLDDTVAKGSISLTKNREALDLGAESGRRAGSQLNELRRKAIAAAEAAYTQTGSLDAAKAAFDRYIGRAGGAIDKMGLTKGAAKQLRDEISRMPAIKTTDVRVNIKVSGLGQLQAAQNALGGIGGLTAGAGAKAAASGIKLSASTTGSVRDENAMRGRASGGWVMPGITYRVNEKGQEFITPNRQAFVHPAGSGAARTTVVEHRLIIEGTGVLAGLRREILALGGDPQTVLGRG